MLRVNSKHKWPKMAPSREQRKCSVLESGERGFEVQVVRDGVIERMEEELCVDSECRWP